MIKEHLYKYLGTNGVICSPVYLENIYCVKVIKLTAIDGKKLTNGEKVCRVITIPEEDLDQWYEIDDPNGQL